MTIPVKQLKDENGVAFYPKTAKAAIADFPSGITIAQTTTVTSVSANSETTIQSLTIPEDGKYKICAIFRGYGAASSGNVWSIYLRKGSQEIESMTLQDVAINGTTRPYKIMMAIANCNANDTVSYSVKFDGGLTVTPQNCKLIAERVA